MRVLMINCVCGVKSTGRICTDLAEELQKAGHTVRIAYGRGTVPPQYAPISYKIGTSLDTALHGAYARAWDAAGWGSRAATERFLAWVREYEPDMIHLHNLHGYYINIELLFRYLRQSGKPVIWTLHDCWAFTGNCPHFDAAGCDRWKTQCGHCPQRGTYPASLVLDRSAENFRRKRAAFTGLPRMTLVTPSAWLAGRVRESFLKEYPIRVIPNGIDLARFRPVPPLGEMDRLRGKKVVLGVASAWSGHKGLDTFLRLARALDDDYRVVLVGLTRRQMARLPQGVTGALCTDSPEALAAWYSRADVFVNASLEETMGMTSVEAAACGAPILCLNATALPEIAQALGGAVVEPGDFPALCRAVRELAAGPRPGRDPRVERYSKQTMLARYLKLYIPGETGKAL